MGSCHRGQQPIHQMHCLRQRAEILGVRDGAAHSPGPPLIVDMTPHSEGLQEAAGVNLDVSLSHENAKRFKQVVKPSYSRLRFRNSGQIVRIWGGEKWGGRMLSSVGHEWAMVTVGNRCKSVVHRICRVECSNTSF